MLLADLHIHTAHSKDGESRVRDILHAAEHAGLDLIAITDHDTAAGCLEAETIPASVLVIPGVEISTAEGHLIALGITTALRPGVGILETIRMIHAAGGIAILPHPYHRYRHGAAIRCREVIAAVDAVEVFNSRYIFGSANRKAAKIARKLKKPMVAGSDAHHARFVGYGLTYIDAEKNVPSVLAAIRAGKTQPAGRKTPVRIYARQSLRNSWRKIRRRIHR